MEDERKFISVITRGETGKVYLHEILYVESNGRKIYIFTEQKVYSMYRKMDEIAQSLPQNFYRCHKSCIINLEKVKNMKRQTIYFDCGLELMMGVEKFTKANQTYRGYLIRHENNTLRETEKE